MIDCNEDLNKGNIARDITQFGMRYLVKYITGQRGLEMYFRDKNNIF